ncbi:MAG: Crp/Fnr family transcriptional regulator [Oscillospiraceae bacterium]|nr:Crp/Fnr family transcriptional regulator [Oscillospiraceae bacterium]
MDDFSLLAEGRQAKRYSAGQLIYLQDTPAEAFYYLKRGVARSYISSPSGGERILTVYRDGSLLGEASFFDGCPRVSSAVAVTDCDLVAVDHRGLDQVFQKHPELALPMLQYLARTVRLLSSHVDAATFLPARERLARQLLSEADGDRIYPCTHEELGFAIGASRVTVSRLISEFAGRGLIRSGYRTITILDRAGLERESGQQP